MSRAGRDLAPQLRADQTGSSHTVDATNAIRRRIIGKRARPRRTRPGRRTLSRSRRTTTIVALAPWVVGFLGFIIGPLLASLWLAFTNYNIFTPPRWTGLDNVREMFSDPNFRRSWRLTLVYGLLGTVYMLALALVAALLIFHAKRASGFWCTLYYFPALLAGASEAFIMTAVWSGNYGLINSMLHLFGIQGPDWLNSSHWAMGAVILMRYWTIGTLMLLFLGARASVSTEYYEAASIDGAGSLRQFRHVTVPMMSPIILLNVILGVIGSIQAFAQVYILTQGGPQGATDLIGIYIYRQAFQNIRMGYGSAISWSLFLVSLLLTLLLIGTSRRWVHYEEGEEW